MPLLSITIVSSSFSNTPHTAFGGAGTQFNHGLHQGDQDSSFEVGNRSGDRETIITQDVPIRVLGMVNVEGIHEPRCREPDVHIVLPPLIQLKAISDRFTKLALTSRSNANGVTTIGPRLELAANMHGCLKISIKTDAMNIASVWTDLSNPDLDPSQVEGGEDGIRDHPSTKMRKLGTADGRSEEGWARVRIDGRDWGKVMSVGRMGGRVIACQSSLFTCGYEVLIRSLGFCNEHALILYVYLPNDGDGEESVLTVNVSPFLFVHGINANQKQYYVSSYSA